jgi:hypothetical protein
MIPTELRAAAERIRAGAVERDPAIDGLPLTGIGWATVERERAERELEPAADWVELERDPALGARRWLRAVDTGGDHDVPALVVLEPETEGRLAASLARFGESVAVAYLGADAITRGRLLRGGPAWGPHVVVAPPAGHR